VVTQLSLALKLEIGRAVAHAVIHRLPTAAARVPARVRPCGICGGQSVTGACLLRVVGFPLLSIPPIASHSTSSIIIRGWYNRPVIASVIVDSVPLQPKKEERSLKSVKNVLTNTIPDSHKTHSVSVSESCG
jgi:hypothetical protein